MVFFASRRSHARLGDRTGRDGLVALLRRPRPARPRWEVIGVGAAVAVFVGISASYALSMPLFLHQSDEKAQLGYAHAIARGELPEIETWNEVPESATLWREKLDHSPDDRYRTVWVANHPPLNYVGLAPFIWFSNATERPDGGLLLARFVNIGFAAIGVALTYLVGYELSRGRRWVGLAATAMVALVPHPHAFVSRALNDGVGLAAVTLLLWAAARYMRRGHSPRGLALLSAAVVLAAASRTAGMLIAVAVVVVVLCHQLLARSVTIAGRLRRTTAVGLAAVTPAVVLIGWFYVRNVRLYGDIGGSSYLLNRFERDPTGSIWQVALDRERWESIFGVLASHATPSQPGGRTYPEVQTYVDVRFALWSLAILAAIGLILVMWPRLGRFVETHLRYQPPATVCRPAALAALAVIAVSIVVVAQHVSGGGNPHVRYLYPALPAIAVLVVVGLDRLVARWLAAIVIAGQAWILVPLVATTGRGYREAVALNPDGGLSEIPGSWSEPRTVALVLAVVGGMMLGAIILGTLLAPWLGRRRDDLGGSDHRSDQRSETRSVDESPRGEEPRRQDGARAVV